MKRIIASAAALVLTLSCVAMPASEKYFNTSQLTASAAETINSITVTGTIDYDESYKVLEMVNKERAANGLSAITMDEDFLEKAVQRSAEISLYYEHERPDGSDLSSLVEGLIGSFGENIAYGFNSAEEVMSKWMTSTDHKANILKSNYKSMGIACFTAADGTKFWVQLFQSNTGTSVNKSGSETESFTVDAKSSLIEPFALVENANSEGTEKQIIVYNKNQTSNTFTTLSASDFNYECETPKKAEVDSNGKITVKSIGNVSIIVTLKSDPNISCTLTFYNEINNNPITPETEHHTIIVDPYSLGDINGDGLVDSSDASAALAYYAEISTGGEDYFTAKQKNAGDVNTDKAIDSADASSILSYYSFIATGGNVTMTEFMK